MVYRVIQWGTGNVGMHALRHIVERPDFELVGLRVYNPDKVGKDAGDMLGVRPTGVIATDNRDEILAIDADCVSYNPLGGTLEAGETALDNICALLASGKNVVSSAVEQMAYLLPDLALAGVGDRAYDRLSEACDRGQTTFFHVGINPGYAMDFWPLLLGRLSRRIDRIYVAEILSMADYPSEHMMRDAMGFARPPAPDNPVDAWMSRTHDTPFYLCMRMIADGLGVELDDVRYGGRQVALAEKSFEIAIGTVEVGTVAAMKFHLEGIVKGRVAIHLEWVWRLTDDVAHDWPKGEGLWVLDIAGDPHIRSKIQTATTFDAGRPVSLLVSTTGLNSIPTVCAAKPGLLNNLRLPAHGGGYVAPSAPA